MKKLFLHVGAGKTGSSALQIWLYEHVKVLEHQNISYPLFNHKIDNEYQITSGNGVFLFNAIKEKKLEKVFKKYFKKKNLLFSSEVLQGLTIQELMYLKEYVKGEYEIKIILYMRNLYDILFSLYQQLIKRHLYSEDFEFFINNSHSLQQFDVLKKYEEVFEDIFVVHYDSHKEHGIEKPFCKILDVELPEMKKNRVNRSLTLFEIEIVKQANRFYKEAFNSQDFSFSSQLSDALIYNDPEKQTEVYFNEQLSQLIEDKFQKEIDYVNKKYLSKGTLTVFRREEQILIDEIRKIPNEFGLALKTILNFVKTKDNLIVEKEKKFDLVAILVREASKREESDIEDAIKIIETALILRPQGERIKKILQNYLQKKENLLK